MGMGINVHLGLAKENSWGTAIGATDYIALVRTTLNPRKEYVSRDELLGNWAAPEREEATRYGEGDIEYLVKPNVFGHILRSMFGPPVTTLVATVGGNLYQHDFTQIDSRYSNDVHFWPYTFELHRDVEGNSRQFQGSIASALRLAIQAGPGDPFLRASNPIVAKDVASITATSPSFEAYGPYKAWHSALVKDGSTISIFEQLEFNVNNNPERVYRLNTTQLPAAMQRNNYQEVDVTGRMSFNDESEFDRFRNNSVGAFEMTFTQSDATAVASGRYPQLIVTLPVWHYTAYTVDIGGPARLVAGFNAYGKYHAGSTTAIRFRLLNERASY